MPECQVFLFRKNQPILPGFIISISLLILCRQTGLLCSGGVAGFAPDYSASIQGKLREIDGWVRNRLRYCIWHDWKKPERRRKNLIRLGVDYRHAYAWSRTRMGGWAVSQSPILTTTITLDRLKKRGYVPMLDYYLKVAPQLNEPSRLSRDGVRGAPRHVLLTGPSTRL